MPLLFLYGLVAGRDALLHGSGVMPTNVAQVGAKVMEKQLHFMSPHVLISNFMTIFVYSVICFMNTCTFTE